MGFIVATLVTVLVTIHTETVSLHEQDAIAKIAAFRQSSGGLDEAARDVTFSVLDQDHHRAQAQQAFDHAVIKHLKDTDALGTVVSAAPLRQYRSAVIYSEKLAHQSNDEQSQQEFLISMAVVHSLQNKLLSKAESRT